MPVINSRPCFLTPKPPKPEYPLFIFLPGLDGTGQLLRSQIGFLEAAFDIRSLAISPADFTGWDALAIQVGKLIASEVNKGQKRLVYLCGESFGGCLALKVIQQVPQLIDRLILINPASSFCRQPLLSWGSCLVSWIPSWVYSASTVGLIPFLAATERISRDVLQQLQETLQIVPQQTTIWRLSLLREFQITEAQIKTITQPTLIIAGVADRLLPSVSEARYLVGMLPNAQMAILPNSGHACLLERDVDLFKLLRSQKFIELPGIQSVGESAMIMNSMGY